MVIGVAMPKSIHLKYKIGEVGEWLKPPVC